jgi:hypothetical protein
MTGSAKPGLRIIAICLMAAFIEGYDLQSAGIVGPLLARYFDLGPALVIGLAGSHRLILVPAVGLEPTTYRLQGGCSTS